MIARASWHFHEFDDEIIMDLLLVVEIRFCRQDLGHSTCNLAIGVFHSAKKDNQ